MNHKGDMKMAKRIMIVTGSPRANGNTAVLAQWVAEGARQAGAEVELVDAAKIKYATNGCVACMACQKSPDYGCVIKDEASEVLKRMPSMDTVVFATPIFFMGFTAQIKLLIDRMYSMVKIKADGVKHAFPKTSFALIANCAGDEGSGLLSTRKNMEAIAGFMGKPLKSLLAPFTSHEIGAILKNDELKAKAVDFGAELLKG